MIPITPVNSNFISGIVGYIKQLFADMSPLMYITIGLVLGFAVIDFIIWISGGFRKDY